MNKYYNNDNDFTLYLGDSFKILKKIKEESANTIFADPPYFLSNNGITCKSGEMVSVNKGEWDISNMTLKEKIKYNKKWIKECRRILKDDGSIFISGTHHNIHLIGVALLEEGFIINNDIIWRKTNPAPNLACKTFTHSNEIVIFASKNNKFKYNYKLMKQLNNNKQLKDVWDISSTKKSEKKNGYHPTQKPLELLNKIILSTTDENDVVLDPFNGSGTTGISSYINNRKYIGIDNNKEYLDLTIRRYEEVKYEKGI